MSCWWVEPQCVVILSPEVALSLRQTVNYTHHWLVKHNTHRRAHTHAHSIPPPYSHTRTTANPCSSTQTAHTTRMHHHMHQQH